MFAHANHAVRYKSARFYDRLVDQSTKVSTVISYFHRKAVRFSCFMFRDMGNTKTLATRVAHPISQDALFAPTMQPPRLD